MNYRFLPDFKVSIISLTALACAADSSIRIGVAAFPNSIMAVATFACFTAFATFIGFF